MYGGVWDRQEWDVEDCPEGWARKFRLLIGWWCWKVYSCADSSVGSLTVGRLVDHMMMEKRMVL